MSFCKTFLMPCHVVRQCQMALVRAYISPRLAGCNVCSSLLWLCVVVCLSLCVCLFEFVCLCVRGRRVYLRWGACALSAPERRTAIYWGFGLDRVPFPLVSVPL